MGTLLGVITVERTFAVNPAPEAVIDYLKDFAHAEEWDPGTQRCVRSDAGPVAVGSTWQNTSKFLGLSTELLYQLEKLDADGMVFVGRNKTATSTDTISVRPDGSGSTITYRAELAMNGLAKLGAPLIKLEFERLGNATEKKLTEVLNRRA